MKSLTRCLLLCLLELIMPHSAAAGEYEISAQTMDCAGNIGFASFDSRDLFKMQPAHCVDPATGLRLQQILLKSKTGLVRYDILSVTQEEGRLVMQQISELKAAKLKNLTRPDVVIEKETVIVREQPAAPVAAPVPAPAPAVVPTPPVVPEMRGDLPGPAISIVDPPVGNSRSITNIITSPDGAKRTVVGKIEAAAGLVSLTVNDRRQEVNEHGMFTAEVAVGSGQTPVTVVAVDNQGKRSSVEFRFLPEPAKEQATVDAAEAGAGNEFFGKYYALIVANNQYAKLDNLKTPENDAAAIAGILQSRYGFTVTRLTNANRYEILSALNTMRRDLTEKDNLLIYYAGHGEYDRTNNRGHWLPVDAESDSTANWISTVAITDIINAMSVKHVLVIADSCYSGALTREVATELDPGMSEETRMKWLRAIAKTRSRYVMTSGDVKPVLDDSGNGHSIFANALIGALSDNQGILEGSKLFREVKARVTARAEELSVTQAPQYAQLQRTGHEFGEFLLVGRK